MKLIHYYHVYCGGGGQWQLIMNQHMMALCNYGLIEQLDEIRVGIVGPPDQRKAVKEILDNSLIKDKVKVVVTRTNAYEQATLTEMYKASQDEDAVYLYAHTKGASDPSLINQLWNRSMTFFNVVAWERCLQLLEGVDAVGCHWITKEQFPHMADANNPEGFPYFGGTYWWAKSSHIKELGEPVRDNRWQAEHWIGKKPDTKVHDTNAGWPSPERFVITF
jgi:hypothetical protein